MALSEASDRRCGNLGSEDDLSDAHLHGDASTPVGKSLDNPVEGVRGPMLFHREVHVLGPNRDADSAAGDAVLLIHAYRDAVHVCEVRLDKAAFEQIRLPDEVRDEAVLR